MMKIKEPSQLAVQRAMSTLLEGFYFPNTLAANKHYSRVHDDCEGVKDYSQSLSVIIAHDSDVWITIGGFTSLRFRVPFIGGGMSPRVRNGLLVLAEAIRRDNEEIPRLKTKPLQDDGKLYRKPIVQMIITTGGAPENGIESRSSQVDTGLRADELFDAEKRAIIADQFRSLYRQMWKVNSVSLHFNCQF